MIESVQQTEGASPRRIVPAWLHGTLLAAWTVGLAWVYDIAVIAGFGRLEPGAMRRFIGPQLVLEAYGPLWIRPWVETPELVFAFAVFTGMVLGALAGVLGRRLDPSRVSRDAFWWPLIRVRGFWIASIASVVAIGASMHFERALGNWSFAAPAVVAAACLMLPFGILQCTVLLRQDGSGWWRPRWPGLAVAASFFAGIRQRSARRRHPRPAARRAAVRHRRVRARR